MRSVTTVKLLRLCIAIIRDNSSWSIQQQSTAFSWRRSVYVDWNVESLTTGSFQNQHYSKEIFLWCYRNLSPPCTFNYLLNNYCRFHLWTSVVWYQPLVSTCLVPTYSSFTTHGFNYLLTNYFRCHLWNSVVWYQPFGVSRSIENGSALVSISERMIAKL